jgi:hypothetical protein
MLLKNILLKIAVSVLIIPVFMSCGENGDGTDSAALQDSEPYAVVTLGDEQFEYDLRCAPDSGDGGALIVSGRIGYGGYREVLGGFGYQDRDDKLTVDEAGTRWMAEAGDGPEQLGDIHSVKLDLETGTVSGEALFKNFDGEKQSGSFEFRCP